MLPLKSRIFIPTHARNANLYKSLSRRDREHIYQMRFVLLSEFHIALHVGGQQRGIWDNSREIAADRPQIRTSGFR